MSSVVLLAFGPGVLLAAGLRTPWRLTLPLAPALSLFAIEIGADILYLLSVPYTRATAGAVLLLLVVACAITGALATRQAFPLRRRGESAWGLRPLARARAWLRDPAWPPSTWAGIGVGLLLMAVPLLIGMGSLAALLQQWDGVFHLSAIRAIRDEQIGSALWGLAPLYQGEGLPSFYPSAATALLALAPAPGVEVLNAGIIVYSVLVWPLGLVLLVAELEHRRGVRRGAVVTWVVPSSALLISVPAVLFPLLSAYPYAVSTVLLPAVLGAGLALAPGGSLHGAHAGAGIALALAGGGVIVAHPISLASLALLAGPATVAGLVSWWRGAPETERRRRRPTLAAGFLCVIVLTIAFWKLSAPVRAYDRGGGANPIGEFGAALIDLTPLWRVTDYPLAGAIPTILAAGTLIGWWSQGRRTWAVVGSLSILIPIAIRAVARVDVLGLQSIAGPWYSQAARLAPLHTIGVAVLAAFALAWASARLGWRSLGVVIVVTALLTGAWRIPARTALVAAAYRPGEIAWGTMVDDDDLAALTWLREQGLPGDGAIIGDPANGAAFAYGYAGVDSRARQLSLGTYPQGVREALHTFSDTPAVACEALQADGVRYLYLDSDTGAQGAKTTRYAQGMYGIDTERMALVQAFGTVEIRRLPRDCSVLEH
ncbi:MAG: hypothetical protein Q4P36_04735 [Bowdeniella nasicola]|nr:hypothetical protein [Bowdeniella nasicola]